MKNITTIIAGSIIGLSLLAFTVSVRPAAHLARGYDAARVDAQREYSDLQKDELSLTSDVKLLRRDLRRGTGAVAIAKDRNFVRQDLLNIVLDRWQPAEESQVLERDQDLAGVIGESFAGVTQEVIHDLAPANHG